MFWGAAKLTLVDGPLTPFDLDRLNAETRPEIAPAEVALRKARAYVGLE